ncbi:MAG TPA: hypothetical protein VNY05_45820 [Candidatus Acidoferrales bacterium]|nr:hypothetical protein [Candidatus Acidoferrales bacterium]
MARRTRYAHLWLPGYLRDRWRRRNRPAIQRVWVLFADHYEPLCAGADRTRAKARVAAWSRRWPEIAARHHDSAGRPPQYTFFYPEEEYRPELLDPLAEMSHAGIADVEVHLHHDGEGEQNFIDRISSFTETLHRRHGLLRTENGRLAFGFIHGNWSLCNSGPRCGLNNELPLLKQLGCYADFTFPAVPHPAQPRLLNTIYWATDDPQLPKSYDTGVPVTPGRAPVGDLLMVPGPLAVNWRGGRLLPHIETGELAAHNPITAHRVNLWLDAAPSIGADVFIKLYAHGAREDNATALLGRDLDLALSTLRSACSERRADLHFVSAWQMREAIGALRLTVDPVKALAGEVAIR